MRMTCSASPGRGNRVTLSLKGSGNKNNNRNCNSSEKNGSCDNIVNGGNLAPLRTPKQE